MLNILGKILVNSVALFVVAYILPGFVIEGLTALVVTAIVMGAVNTFIRPVLQILFFPITLVTFGIAAFLINVTLLWTVSLVVPGFTIDTFLTAVVGSLALTFVSWFLHHLAKDEAPKRKK